MKHFSVSGNTLAVCSGHLRSALLTVLFFLAWLGQHTLRAQCDMRCTNPDMVVPRMIEIDNDCAAKVRAIDLLAAPETCPGGKTLTIRDGMGMVVAFAIDSATFDASTYVNQLLSVTVTDTTSGLFCVSFIATLDKSAPVIDCQNFEMTCVEEATIEIVEFPEVNDNCDADVDLQYHDEIMGTPCEKIIQRTWTAMDDSGNETICLQIITITRPSLAEITFPKDTTMNCNAADTTVAALGQPLLDSIPIGDICNLSTSRRDTIEYFCDSITYQIKRFWTVIDDCSGEMVRDTQMILVQDTLAPDIKIQNTFVATTDPGQCYGTVNLPVPELLDNCDNTPTLFVSTSYGAVGLGPHPFVPVGPHTVQYTAVDACGNTKVFKMQLNVVDEEPPAAICEDNLVVSLPAVGVVTVPAKNFNKGSSDNCAPKLYYKVHKMTTGTCEGLDGDDSQMEGYQEWFDDKVNFCCADTDSTFVTVIMRVYEIDPGAGPVNPSREQPGGDLYRHYNECMVRVNVQDKLPPIIKCPVDVTISCTDDYTDLSIFGSPTVDEICGYTLDSTSTENLNECNVGTITRTFTATDRFGNKSSCTQTITVINPSPLKESDIDWPEMYVIGVCGANTDPEDLPAGFDKPVVNDTSCNFFATYHSDQFFDVAFPACYKILRTWEIIDWCKFDPEHPGLGGKFKYIQTIKVEDSEAPVISCPADVIVSTGNNCGPVAITLPAVTAQDCNPNIIITNDSPYATSGGANASGNYPIGTTTVTFIARDRCGNTATCKVKITVEDKTPPSPICIVGLSANLTNKDGIFQAQVSAKAFNGGSFDNCTSKDKLKYSLRRPGTNTPAPPTDTMLVFTCGDLGNQVVELWVTDEQGNSDYCVTYISIQDNNGLCPLPASGMIAGGIQTERGDFVEHVNVRVNSNAYQVITGHTGLFEFAYLPLGGDYTLVPEKNDDVRNGISTIDVLLVIRHILGVQTLNSPYKIIAADVDRSGDVSLLDIIRLRKLVLGIDEQLPNGNKSWRFVKKDFNFPDPRNPFKTNFPELYNINDFSGNMMDADFVAVKVGDVDFSARPNSAVSTEARAGKKALVVTTTDQPLKANETYTLELKATKASDLQAFQFAMTFDPELLEFVTLDPGNIPDISDANFGLQMIDEGLINASWNISGDKAVPDEPILFRLTLRAKAEVSLGKAIQLNPRYLKSEAFNQEEEVLDIQLNFSEPAAAVPENALPVEGSFELYQNRPNPVATETVVPFRLPETTYAKLTIYDATGRVVYNREGEFPQGYNEVIINRSEVKAEGMLYYRLETLGRHQTKKMILLD
ncbi:MAG: HYR domain-containing protein [Saprospiraceae bacterium]|nr:HYR domain-containing protein [Saprospiraceae bacterium]